MALIMNTTEIESALVNLSTTYPGLCQRIALPEQTHEGRTCHALRIAKNYDPQRPAVVILGGVHAREWGGPDIVVNFAGDLLRAYSQGKGLQYGNKTFSATELASIVESTTVVVFPCVNPDGVRFSHTQSSFWRKNRNPAHFNGGNADTVGVDINRNYDFLWDYKTHFHPATWDDSLASDNPGSYQFHGDTPFSEPETRNVKWLMDSQPHLTLFLDLHSYTGDVLYNWGDDQNQIADGTQTFTNPAHDGQRGLEGDAGYREYISAADLQTASSVAAKVRDAMKAARGRPYKSNQAFGLYPTSGASDDYAFSRHIANPALPKTFGFTLEFNFQTDAPNSDPLEAFVVTQDPQVLDNTMIDVIPGLIALCLAAPGALIQISPIGEERVALRIIYLNQATGEVWYIGADGKIHKIPPQPDPYRSAFANQAWRLLNAYEAVSAIPGPSGTLARRGLLNSLQALAAAEAKSRPG